MDEKYYGVGGCFVVTRKNRLRIGFYWIFSETIGKGRACTPICLDTAGSLKGICDRLARNRSFWGSEPLLPLSWSWKEKKKYALAFRKNCL